MSLKRTTNEESPKMESNNKRHHPNPLDGANVISKLARVYNQRVKETRTAKELEMIQESNDNCEITAIGSKVAEPVVGPKPDYKQAPTLTLKELIPTNFQAEVGPSSKFHTSFRSDRVEFVLMCRKLDATGQQDLEWELPENATYNAVITEASATFIEANIEHADALLWSSVGQTTGIGMFAMPTAKLDLVKQFPSSGKKIRS